MISYTHFADIVRMTLIAERGGIWIDATTLVCKNIPEEQENLAIITRKSQPLIKSGVFHRNRFTCWCIGSPYLRYPLFCFVSEILLEYCLKEKQWIDYLFMDYLLAWGIDNIPIVVKDFLEIPCTNENAFMLTSKMESAFDKKQFEEYCQNTWFFKMSIKRPYSDYTVTGEATYYKKWKDNALFD